MSYDIKVKNMTPQSTVSIRTQCAPAELGATLAEILPEVWKYLRDKGVYPSGPPYTRYHGYDSDKVDIEGGMPVAEAVEGNERIQAGELPGGDAASTVHVGPYERLPDAHDALDGWIKDKGKESAGPQWEIYITDPGAEPDPGKRQTELVWPLK